MEEMLPTNQVRLLISELLRHKDVVEILQKLLDVQDQNMVSMMGKETCMNRSLVNGDVITDGVFSNVRKDGDNHQRSPKKTATPWRSLFRKIDKDDNALDLFFVTPVEKEDDIMAYCSKEVYEKDMEEWQNTLVGNFLGRRPSFLLTWHLKSRS